MSVHQKLMQARIKLQGTKLTKSGHNKFAGYKYFELGDFLPAIQDIFNELGLCGVISYLNDYATLTITDIENPIQQIFITSPMSTAALKGCHEVQNLGAVQTYIRRYLWVTAMEIVEHDVLDATTGSSEPSRPKKTAPLPTKQSTDRDWAISITNEEKWLESVKLATHELLKFVSSKNDVLEIFKVNRPIFERLMTEDKAEYDNLMAVFAENKNRFEE